MPNRPITLKFAKQSGNLDPFIVERESLPPGDMAAFERCLTSMAKTKKAAREASSPEPSGD